MYKRFAIVTIAAVYFLILVGGIVRATGSGMGCPDWPKCFGMWVPPTNEADLPLNYQEIFGEKLKGEVEFNVFKTWTEYVNRLLGVSIGLLIFGTLLGAWLKYRKRHQKIVWMSLLAFVLVGLEGFLGSKVVSSELNPVLITLHLVLAIGVVIVLIYALFLAYSFEDGAFIRSNRSFRFAVSILMLLSLVQLFLGTQIRQMIDLASFSTLPRTQWIDTLEGGRFYMHITMAVVVLFAHIWFYWNVRKEKGEKVVWLDWLLALVVFEFATGGVLGMLDIPAYSQPIHLTLATVILGIQFLVFLIFGEHKRIEMS
ncbi:MAG: cytochrome c oxidase assembly protein subunit 15 [Arcticibacterium sp.]|jgi:cytochrome c oxidase assembly protein subunit 15